MTETIDWDDPESRLALIERVGVEAYNKALEEHWAATAVDNVNGYPIRTVTTRFGRLFAVVAHTDKAFAFTTKAYTTIDEAREFASRQPSRW